MPEAEKKTKGHWPKGKSRNEDSGHWSRTRLLLQKLMEDHFERGACDLMMLARELGTDDKSIWRWKTGKVRPSPEIQDAIAAWVEEMRKAMKKKPK